MRAAEHCGGIGSGLALAGVRVLEELQPGGIPRIEEVAVNGTVLAFTLAVSVAVGVVFGLVPAASRGTKRPTRNLGAAGRNRSGGSRRVRDLLVVGEVALSFVLLTGGVLLARSFLELRRVDPGFEPEGVATVPLSFPEERYANPQEIGVALDGMLERVASLPGVAGVGAASILPFSGMGGDTYVYAEDRPPARIRNIENTAQYRLATEGYFRTLGIPVEQGRAFTREDVPGSAEGVVLNRTLADALFPDGDPVGQRVVIALDTLTAVPVIGVVSDSRQFGLGRPPAPEFHLSARQAGARSLQLVVRGRDGAAPPADELRRAVWEVDPRQTVPRVSRMENMVDGSLAPSRFQASLVGLFAALAVALAAVGIYGVLVQAVNDRRREIGVRMAMGAQGRALVRMVVGRGLKMGVLGLAVGAVGAVVASRLLESLLFGVAPRDPATFALTPVFLLGVVVLSAWLPARRATRTDPVEVLREEV
jgi:putative ABC transport system permease protein